MKCSHCSTDNPSSAKFCVECGTPLVKTKACVVCYQEIPQGAKFCPQCNANQADNPFVLAPSEVLRLQTLFINATSSPSGLQELKARMKIALTQTEWNALPGVPEFLPQERLIVYVPQQDMAIIRNDVVFSHLEFNRSKVTGSLFITNYRAIVVDHAMKKAYTVRYKSLQSYNRPGGASIKQVSLILTSNTGENYTLVFVTPASGKVGLVFGLLSALDGKQDIEQERREERARDFRTALDEWMALIVKRWH